MRAFNHLEKLLNVGRENKSSLSIAIIIYDITSMFEISEKAILRRIDLLKEVKQDFNILNKEIVFKEVK